MANNKGIKSLWGYPLIDEKARNAIDDARSNLENNFQKKTDDTLGTTDKTVPGAINEIKNNIDTIGDNFTSEKTDTKYDMKYNGKSIGSINIELEEDQIAGGDGTFNINLTPYQTKNDDNLTTTNKTIVGSINEVKNSIDNINQINDMRLKNLLPVILNWRKIRIDGNNGNETASDAHISTDKFSFNSGETVTSSNISDTDFRWFVYQYDEKGTFEKILINSQKVFTFIVESDKKYAFQLWSGSTDFSTIKNKAQVTITDSTRDIVNSLETKYHEGFDYLTIDWVPGEINRGNGAFVESDTSIRSDYINIPHNEEITLGKCGDWYWFVNTYDKKTHKFKGCIIDTKAEATFTSNGNLSYVFALWSGNTDFTEIKNNYKIKVTKNKIIDYLFDKTLNNVQWDAKLDLPDFMVVGKGESIELFKYGMFYTTAPNMQNLYNVRVVNIGDYVQDYTERIIINCPTDFSGTEIKSEQDLPLFQLLDGNGNVIDFKRVHIYVVDKSATFTNKTVAYLGDSLTAMQTRSKYASSVLSTKNITLVGKFTGDTDENKYTAQGGCTWWNYLEDPTKLPSARKENYLWDTTTNAVSLQKFYTEVNGGNPVDVMVILLGWNDFENGAFNKTGLGLGLDKIAANVRRFLNIIKTQSPTTKVILESYHYGYPGLIKGAYSNSMSQIIHNKHIKELNELYLTVSKEFDNVYFLPNSTRIDVLHGMTTDLIAVNKYSTEKQTYCLDTVHPADIGYHQYSDAEVDMILYALSK